MDAVTAGVLAAGAGAAVGLAAGLAFAISDRAQRTPPAAPRPAAVPEGVDQVLSVLRSSAIVLDSTLAVVKASPSAYAFGLIGQDRLAVPELLDLARQVRRDGEIRALDLQVPRSANRAQNLHVCARVAPLDGSLLLILVEDRTQAVRVDQVRRDFVANVSHELKTPVGALALLAEAVQGAKDEPDAVSRFAGRMQHETARLARLVQEIIDLSRLQYDDPVDSPERVSVDQVIEAAFDRSRVDADARQITLASGGTRGLFLFGSPEQLAMALGNLIENAVAYSPPGSHVAVGVRPHHEMVEISIRDQGMGIAQDELDRIFERFYRGDPARSRSTGGSGLGLSIVKHIAAGHGGDITVRSTPGEGSTFTLRLPLHDRPAGSAVGRGGEEIR